MIEPKAPHADCAHCPAAAGKCVLPEVASGALRLAIVGEGPGRTEIKEGRPLVGASGRMMDRGLCSIGLRRANVHVTNAILCDCSLADVPKAAKACRPRLVAELARVRAPVVMPLGAYALQGALGMPKRPQIMKWRGSVTPIVYNNQTPIDGQPSPKGCDTASHGPSIGARTATLAVEYPEPISDPGGLGGKSIALVCPTLHPSFVSRAEKWAPVLEIDVARVGRLLGASPASWRRPEEDPGRRMVFARTWESLTTALASLIPQAPVSFDVETVGLGPTETALVCYGLSDGHTTIVVPWARWLDGKESWWGMSEGRVQAAVSAALATRTMVTHNGPAFDHLVAERYGLRWGAWDDTLMMAHVMAGHMPKNLAHVVTQGLDVGAWKFDSHADSIETMWLYNGRDCLYTILRYLQMAEEIVAA